jgi:hypothetical protein
MIPRLWRRTQTIAVNRSYLVKINLVPATRRTVARKSEITRTAKRLLPKSEAIAPPMIFRREIPRLRSE